MRIFEADFDKVSPNSYCLKPQEEIADFEKYPPEFYRQALVELQKISLPTLAGHEVVALVRPEATEKDGMWHISATRVIGWELKADTPVFGSNHIQIWIANKEGTLKWHISDLFHQAAFECFEQNNPAGIEILITKRMIPKVEWYAAQKLKEINGLHASMRAAEVELLFLAAQNKLLERLQQKQSGTR